MAVIVVLKKCVTSPPLLVRRIVNRDLCPFFPKKFNLHSQFNSIPNIYQLSTTKVRSQISSINSLKKRLKEHFLQKQRPKSLFFTRQAVFAKSVLHEVSCWILSTKLGQLSICLVFFKFCLYWAAQSLLRGTGLSSKPIKMQDENSWLDVSKKLSKRNDVWCDLILPIWVFCCVGLL